MLGAAGVLFHYLIAHVFPGYGVGRLAAALGSASEDARSTAYMALVKLGPRNAARLVKEAREGRETLAVLQVLGDLGDLAVIGELEEFTRSRDPEVAAAARESIEVLRGRGE